MYWCKPAKKFIAFTCGGLVLCLGYACKPEIKETGAAIKYFDLKEFFRADSARLTRRGKPVTKTVTHNGESETKQLKITNWGRELSLFFNSDINKPAWKNSYTIINTADSLVYKAKFPELKTRELVIKKINGKVSAIYIKNSIHNLLYSTTEELNYIPGAYYLIQKTQQVKVMGANNYTVKGVF